MSTAAVEFLNVTKVLGHQWVLNGISLRVEAGEFLSLLGPSGCGKTTSLRLLAGFDHPTTGEVLVNGHSMIGKPPYQRDLNMVFQNYALFPHLTVFRNVAFGLEMQGMREAEIQQRVPESLELVRLAGMEQRYPHQLSGGQQQRVALARALVRRPSVLLLDEPLGALDLRLRKEMQVELKKLQRHVGITFIYVTHDQEEALAMSDRIAVMHQGRILQLGSPEDIYERPSNRFVADFVGQMNFWNGQIAGVENGVTLVRKDGTTFRSRRSGSEPTLQTGQEVTVAIRPEKIHLASAPLPAMENAFPVVVEEIAYLGTDTQYSVRISDALSFTVRQQNSTANQTLRVGTQAHACFSAEALRILAA